MLPRNAILVSLIIIYFFIGAKTILERLDGVNKYVCYKIAPFFHSLEKTNIHLDSIEPFLYCLSSKNF